MKHSISQCIVAIVLGLLACYASQLNAFAISLTVKSALAFLILI
ncbi:hypothetical protein ACUOFC_12060, partial [Escherichia sp. TWPC-MK]